MVQRHFHQKNRLLDHQMVMLPSALERLHPEDLKNLRSISIRHSNEVTKALCIDSDWIFYKTPNHTTK